MPAHRVVARVVEVGVLARRAQIQRAAGRVAGPEHGEAEEPRPHRLEEAKEVRDDPIVRGIVVLVPDAVVVRHDVGADLAALDPEHPAEADLAAFFRGEGSEGVPHRERQRTLAAGAVGDLDLDHRPRLPAREVEVREPREPPGRVRFDAALPPLVDAGGP